MPGSSARVAVGGSWPPSACRMRASRAAHAGGRDQHPALDQPARQFGKGGGVDGGEVPRMRKRARPGCARRPAARIPASAGCRKGPTARPDRRAARSGARRGPLPSLGAEMDEGRLVMVELHQAKGQGDGDPGLGFDHLGKAEGWRSRRWQASSRVARAGGWSGCRSAPACLAPLARRPSSCGCRGRKRRRCRPGRSRTIAARSAAPCGPRRSGAPRCRGPRRGFRRGFDGPARASGSGATATASGVGGGRRRRRRLRAARSWSPKSRGIGDEAVGGDQPFALQRLQAGRGLVAG